jgi:hypothetical protein
VSGSALHVLYFEVQVDLSLRQDIATVRSSSSASLLQDINRTGIPGVPFSYSPYFPFIIARIQYTTSDRLLGLVARISSIIPSSMMELFIYPPRDEHETCYNYIAWHCPA